MAQLFDFCACGNYRSAHVDVANGEAVCGACLLECIACSQAFDGTEDLNQCWCCGGLVCDNEVCDAHLTMCDNEEDCCGEVVCRKCRNRTDGCCPHPDLAED